AGVVALAGFRFEDLADDAVHRFGRAERLLLPAVEVIDDILVGEVAAEDRLAEIVERARLVWRDEGGAAAGAAVLAMEEDRLAFALLGEKDLVDDLGGGSEQ